MRCQVRCRAPRNAHSYHLEPSRPAPDAVVALGILGATGMSPKQIEDIIIKIFGMKGTAVMTNVPGPRKPLYLAGAKISSLMFWVPTPGNLGLGVSIVSYDGKIVLGIATDAGLIPDPELLLESFYQELEFMQSWGYPRNRSDDSNLKISETSAYNEKETLEKQVHEKTAQEKQLCQAATKSGQQCKNRARPGFPTCQVHRDVQVSA